MRKFLAPDPKPIGKPDGAVTPDTLPDGAPAQLKTGLKTPHLSKRAETKRPTTRAGLINLAERPLA